MIEKARQAAQRLKKSLGEGVEEVCEDGRGVVVRVRLDSLLAALEFLKEDRNAPFNMLSDATAVDWSTWSEESQKNPPATRFSIYYNLYSIPARTRMFIETGVGEGQAAPSATGLYASADWAEREIYDMFGIRFSGHPDLRRVLMPEEFEGFPLLKEFPLKGEDPQDDPQE